MAIQAQMYSGFTLGGSQDLLDLLVDNGCGLNDFCLNLPQQQTQRHHPNMQFQPLQNRAGWSQNLRLNNRFLEDRSAVFSRSMESQIDIDMLISLQNENLRLALQEQKKQQISLILKKYESKAQFLLQRKDEEIAKAINQTIELEDLLKRMETENETWQRVAKENEAMIMSLNNTMEQLREGAADCQSGGNGVEDAESCCEIGTKTNAAPTGDPDVQRNPMMCKICSCRNPCVILLPCRHLCSCNVCEAFIESCPVCSMVKKASIEASF